MTTTIVSSISSALLATALTVLAFCCVNKHKYDSFTPVLSEESVNNFKEKSSSNDYNYEF